MSIPPLYTYDSVLVPTDGSGARAALEEVPDIASTDDPRPTGSTHRRGGHWSDRVHFLIGSTTERVNRLADDSVLAVKRSVTSAS